MHHLRRLDVHCVQPRGYKYASSWAVVQDVVVIAGRQQRPRFCVYNKGAVAHGQQHA